MGSICSIYKPKDWMIKQQGINKHIQNDIVYNIIIGEWDDYPTAGEITMWISKINYEKILSHEYFITINAYAERPIHIFDKDKNEIEPVVGVEMDKILGL